MRRSSPKMPSLKSSELMLTMRTGEVVDDVERNRRMAEAKASGEHNFYMMEMGPGLIIDARTKYGFPFYSQLRIVHRIRIMIKESSIHGF